MAFIYVTDATKNPDEQDLNQFKSPINPNEQQNNGGNNAGFNINNQNGGNQEVNNEIEE